MHHPTHTLEQLRQEPHLSYSALNTYLNICQLQYYFRYIEKAESERTSVALPFGTAFHSALSEQAQAAKQGNLMSAEQLKDVFVTYFRANCAGINRVIYKKDSTEDDLIATAGLMLETVTREWCDYWNIEAVALPFRIEIPGVSRPLIGEIDMVVNETLPFNDEPATACLVDFKTAARMWPDHKADRDLQATVFVYAYEQLTGQRPTFRFDVITKAKKPAVQHFYTIRVPDDYLRLEKLVRTADHAIRAGVFLPNETSFACSDCPYAGHCRAWHCQSKSTASGKEVAA